MSKAVTYDELLACMNGIAQSTTSEPVDGIEPIELAAIRRAMFHNWVQLKPHRDAYRQIEQDTNERYAVNGAVPPEKRVEYQQVVLSNLSDTVEVDLRSIASGPASLLFGHETLILLNPMVEEGDDD